MADLGVTIVQSVSGRFPLMPPTPTLLINLALGERYRLAETMTRAITLQAGVSDEVLHATANTVSRILDLAGVGEVAFNASPDHASITNYTARIRVYGNSTVVATQSLGVPTPDGNNVIIVDLTTTLAAQTAGNYTVSILATSAGGSTDSAESAAFSVPL
jgi:hypothetical protein